MRSDHPMRWLVILGLSLCLATSAFADTYIIPIWATRSRQRRRMVGACDRNQSE
jgi:hypothetical protein